MAATPKPVRKAVKRYKEHVRTTDPYGKQAGKKTSKLAVKSLKHGESKEKFGKGMIESFGKGGVHDKSKTRLKKNRKK